MVPGTLSGMDTATKTRENRLRHMAARQRMTLHRSRRRDPRAWDYGRYWLLQHDGTVIGAEAGRLVGDWPGLTLDEVEDWLTRPPGRA